LQKFGFKILIAIKEIETRRKKYNVQKLQMPSVRKKIKVELKNRFSVLSTQNEDSTLKKAGRQYIYIYIYIYRNK